MSAEPNIDKPFKEAAAEVQSAEIIPLFETATPAVQPPQQSAARSFEISAEGKALLERGFATPQGIPQQQQPYVPLPVYKMMPQQQHVGGLLFKPK